MTICFCVGLQRSGTTALSRFLLTHPGITQPNTTDKREANRECWAAFGRLTPVKGAHIVEPEDLSWLDIWETRVRVWRYLRPGKVLYIKTPKNCVRILALKHIFPSCKVVFIRRDPRSILRSWWDSKGYHHLTSGYYQHPYYVKQSDGKYQWQPPPLRGMDLAGVSYAEVVSLAAQKGGKWWDTGEAFRYRVLQLQGAIEYHLDKRSLLPPSDYLEIAYEDLCLNPIETLEELFTFMGVSCDIDLQKARGFFQSRNYKYDTIPEHLREFAETTLRKTALRLGYDINYVG
jgi:hypothetical protein